MLLNTKRGYIFFRFTQEDVIVFLKWFKCLFHGLFFAALSYQMAFKSHYWESQIVDLWHSPVLQRAQAASWHPRLLHDE